MSEAENELTVSEKSFVADIKQIIEEARKNAYSAVNAVMVLAYWNIGRRIVEQEQQGKDRAKYGTHLIEMLAEELTFTFGKGYSVRYIRNFRRFYTLFPDYEIWKSRFPNLTWTHYLAVLRVEDRTASLWYIENAAREMWSVRTLSRNIGTQYFERHFKQPQIAHESKEELPPSQFELLKNPVVAEFLGFKADDAYSETDLESAIITHLKEFLLEMGRGFAFVARQQHIHTDAEDYYIDLVFYNIVLKCYVLIDLKLGKVRHQDVGQMDTLTARKRRSIINFLYVHDTLAWRMYVRMYDELKRTEGDNATIGIVLCSETDEAIAKYSVLHNNDQLFAAKLTTFLPTDKELKAEIERQKTIFYMQHPELKDDKESAK